MIGFLSSSFKFLCKVEFWVSREIWQKYIRAEHIRVHLEDAKRSFHTEISMWLRIIKSRCSSNEKLADLC